MISTSFSYLLARYLMGNSIYTYELAKRGELLTHDKDKSVLTLMSLKDEIETDFLTVNPEYTLGVLVRVIAKSHRNINPVVDRHGKLIGLIDLQDIREIIFDRDRYDFTTVRDLMIMPDYLVVQNEKMESVMNKFEKGGAWKLPVIDDKGVYVGFVSRSRLFNAYRRWLKETSED